MKRIIIICEGQTEQEFCNDVLQPNFINKNISIQNPTIKKTGGGIVRWEALKHQIEIHLKSDNSAVVTTLIDFYGIHEYHNYPNWQQAKGIMDKSIAMETIEKAMYMEIDPELRRRFIPYIQLHEFEGLLFCDIAAFDNGFETDEFLDYSYLVQTINDNENPELINDSSLTAPSKRLMKIIKDYSKITYGSLLAYDIGLNRIRTKCPRFDNWIANLEAI